MDKSIEETTPLANETTYQKLGERFASFFRLHKSGTVTENKDVEAGAEKVMEEVDATKTEKKAEIDETKTEAEKKEEIDETTEEEKSAETKPLANEIKHQTFGERVASFFRLRKTESLNKTEDVEAGTEKVAEDVDATKTKTEKKDEETEGEKGEKDGEEKEKSIVKTKTDIMSCFAGICNKGGNGEKTEEKKEEGTDKETEKKDDEKQVNKQDLSVNPLIVKNCIAPVYS